MGIAAMEEQLLKNTSEIILYRTEDDRTEIQVTLQNETVWLSQTQMAELFQKSVPTINEHIKNIYAEGELDEKATIRNFRIVQAEKKRAVTRNVDFYNLDVIISVGYRVNSHRGTQFRIWATQRLKEYIVKGFVMDDRRLAGGATNYFDEFLILNEKEILTHTGKISHMEMEIKVREELGKYSEQGQRKQIEAQE